MEYPVKPARRMAELYDFYVSDWPGEIEFYCELVEEVGKPDRSLLDVGCGTGRVLLRLAPFLSRAVGLDLSADMLAIARQKASDFPLVNWMQADMRSFDLGEKFSLAIIPGHAFQFMLDPGAQLDCLNTIRRHLLPEGFLVVHLDHQDMGWLGDITSEKKGVFEKNRLLTGPGLEHAIQIWHAWSYERSSQTATLVSRLEAIGRDGHVIEHWETGPTRLHCLFLFEMEHLVRRAGFDVEALYGDFYKQPLQDTSTEMVWVLRPAET